MTRTDLAAIIVGISLLARSAPAAQPGADLVLEPWPDRRLVQTFDNPLVVFDGQIKGRPGSETALFFWDSYGRLRLDRDDAGAPAVGYRLLTADFGLDAADLPDGLNDIALAGGVTIARFDGWNLSVVGGAGYAGDTPFGDADAWYGIGHLIAQRRLNDTDQLAITLDYNGNNPLFPDAPLPGVRYIHRTQTISWTVGFPVNEIRWTPDRRWTLSAIYEAPCSGEASAAYLLGNGWSLYGRFANVYQPFAFAGDAADRDVDRWVFQMRRIEAGVRFVSGQWIDAALGIGYAFDQSLDRGFDLRDLRRQAEFTDRPYLALTLRGSF